MGLLSILNDDSLFIAVKKKGLIGKGGLVPKEVYVFLNFKI